MTQNYVFSNGAAGEDPCLSLGKALKKAASPGPGTTMGDMLKSIVAFPITFLLTTVTYPPEWVLYCKMLKSDKFPQQTTPEEGER